MLKENLDSTAHLSPELSTLPFGKSRSQVIQQLGEPLDSMPNSLDGGLIDYYQTLKIEYDSETQKCCAVEFSGNELMIEGQNLLALTWDELSAWIIKRDPELTPGTELESRTLRIAATSKPPEYREIEAIGLFSVDYRWPIDTNLEDAIQQIDREMAQLPRFEMTVFEDSAFSKAAAHSAA